MNRLFHTLLLSLITISLLSGQGMDFFQGTWAEALEAARKQEKVIFVDAYAEWCGPCKRMARDVFTQDAVGEFYNKNFINVKMDMEKGEGLSFRQKYPVTGFPTLFYIDYTGEIVHQALGGRDVGGFIKLGQEALSKIDRSKAFEEEYNKGNRDPQLVYNYVKTLNQAGKPSLKISNEYLRTQKDLTTDFNLLFILEAAVESDSRIFDLLIENRPAIEALAGKEEVLAQIELACSHTAEKAMEYRNVELIEDAKAKMKAHHTAAGAQLFALTTDMNYARYTDDIKTLTKSCSEYGEKFVSDQPDELFRLATLLQGQANGDEKCLKEAEKLAGMAAEQSDNFVYHFTYGQILAANKKTSQAIAAVQKARDLASQKNDTQALIVIEKYLGELNHKP